MPPSFLSLVLMLAGKDWRVFWQDRRAALLAFTVPIALASAFGLIFARQTDARAATRIQLAVVVEDEGPFAKRIAESLLDSDRCEAVLLTRAEADARIADRRPGVAVVLPGGFDRVTDWKPGANAERPTIRIIHHPLAQAERQLAEGIVTELVMQTLAKEKFGATGFTPPFRTDASMASGSSRASFNSYTHSFSGMTLQYLLFWGMECGLMLLRERRGGAWTRLRTAPVPLAAVLLGKAVSTAGIAFLIAIGTFGFGYVAFGIRIHSWLGFACVAVAASGLAAAAGLLVAALGGSEARARSISILAILGISMLGGLWLPSFLLPGWLRDVSLALPTTWAMRGLDSATWQGLGLQDALRSTGVVAAFAAGFLALAAMKLARAESNRRRGFGHG